ncbi:hypothetical protein MTP02_35000 [Streptomyces albus]|nr:hypothetical protein MTP02_35000 [Streptomyces albus]
MVPQTECGTVRRRGPRPGGRRQKVPGAGSRDRAERASASSRWRTRSVGPKLGVAVPGQRRGDQVRFAALAHVRLYSNVELTSVGKWPPHSPETGHLRAEAGSRP